MSQPIRPAKQDLTPGQNASYQNHSDDADNDSHATLWVQSPCHVMLFV
jgi:hypothetical protein